MLISMGLFTVLIWLALGLTVVTPVLLLISFLKDYKEGSLW